MKVKVKRVRGGSMGDQRNYGLVTGSIWNYEDKPTTNQVSDVLTPVPVDEATIEAERNETIVYPDADGNVAHSIVGGKRHSEGGTPLNIPDGSFVFSDTRSLKIKNKEMLSGVFNYNTSKSVTPAQVAKRYELNKYFDILKDPEADYLDKKTAQMMIDSNMTKLGQLALVQEGMKGFPDGIPDISLPLFQKDIAMQQPAQQTPQMKLGGQFMRRGGKKLPKHQKIGPVNQQGFSYVDPTTERAYYVTPDGVATDMETGTAVSLSPDVYQSILSNLSTAQQQGKLAGTIRIPGERFGEATYMPEVTGPEAIVRPDVTLPGGTQIPANMIYTPPITDQGMIYDADTKPWWDPAYQAYMGVATDPRTKAAGEALTAGAIGAAGIYGASAAAPYAMGALNAVANVPLATTGTTAFTLGDLANAGFLVNTAMDAPDLYRSYRDVAEGKQTIDADLLGKTGEAILGISGGLNLATKFGPGAISSLRSAYPALTSSWKAPSFAGAENISMSAGLPLMAAPAATNVAEGKGSSADILPLALALGYPASKYMFGTKLGKILNPEGKAFVEGMEMGKVKPAYKLKDGTIMDAEQFAYAQQNDPNRVIDAVQGIGRVNRGYSDFDEFVSLPDLFKMQGKRASLFVGRDAVPIQKSNPEYSQDALNKIDEAINTFKGFDESTPLSEVFARVNPTERKKLIDAWNAYVPTEKARINLPQALIDDPSKINAESQTIIDDILGKWNVGEFPWMKSAYVRNNPEVLHGVQYQAGDYRSPAGALLSGARSLFPKGRNYEWLEKMRAMLPKLEGSAWNKTKSILGSGIGDVGIPFGIYYGAGYLQDKAREGAFNMTPSPEEVRGSADTRLDPTVVTNPVVAAPTTADSTSIDSLGVNYDVIDNNVDAAPVTDDEVVPQAAPQQTGASATTGQSTINQRIEDRRKELQSWSDSDWKNFIGDRRGIDPSSVTDSAAQAVKQRYLDPNNTNIFASGGTTYIYDPTENTVTDVVESFKLGGDFDELEKYQAQKSQPGKNNVDYSFDPYDEGWRSFIESQKGTFQYPSYSPDWKPESRVISQTSQTGFKRGPYGEMIPDPSQKTEALGTYKDIDQVIDYHEQVGKINFGEYPGANGDVTKGKTLFKKDIKEGYQTGKGYTDQHRNATKWLLDKGESEVEKRIRATGYTGTIPSQINRNTKGWDVLGSENIAGFKYPTFAPPPPPPPTTPPPPPATPPPATPPAQVPPVTPPKWQPTDRPGGGWSPFALANLYGAVGQRPYKSQNPPLLQANLARPEYRLEDPARQIAALKGAQPVKDLQAITADPSVLRANMSKLADTENLANVIAANENRNVAIMNKGLADNATIANQELMYNQQAGKDYIEGLTTLEARAAQDQARKNAQVLASLKYGQDEARSIDFQNIANAKNYYYDNTTGTVRFMPGYFEGSGQTDMMDLFNDQRLKDLSTDQKLKYLEIYYGRGKGQQQNPYPGYPYYNPTGNPYIS